MMGDRFWLSDAQWAIIKPLLPRLGSRPRLDDRRVISGILHRYRQGLRWRAVPADYGPHTTLFNRWNRWSAEGIWQALPWSIALRFERTTRRPALKGSAVAGDRTVAW